MHTTDTGGGVARKLMILLDGLQARGVDTWLVVGAKHSVHPRVVWMHESPHVDYRPYRPWRRRELTRIRWRLDRAMGREDFEHPFTRHVLEMTGGTPPDLVLCENLHGGYFDLRMLPWLSHRVPLVLSLNDSWLFTGHCACPLTCGRWEGGCGRCPDLEIPPAVRRDATAGNWRRKRDILAASRVWALSPSRWMLERSRRSLLGPALKDARVVEHGIDLNTFSPGSRLGARRALGVDPDSVVMLYVANLGATNPTKDFPTLRKALQRFAQEAPLVSSDGRPIPIQLLVVGCRGAEEQLCEYVSIRHLPRCDSQAGLAEFYRASDLYVHSAREEAFSLTTAEALACGTVAVAAAGGGIREVIEHGRTGLLVEPGDDAALAAALRAMVEDPARRASMSVTAAETARARFNANRMVDETLAWCHEVVGRCTATAG